MRKLLVAVLAFGLLSAVSTTSYAAYASVGITSVTAQVSFVAAGSIEMNAVLRNLTGETTTQLWWDTGNITLGSTKWRRSDAYVMLHSTITAATGGIEIYTNNRNAAIAAQRYTGGAGTDPAGLVGLSSTTAVLPMAWRITAISTTSLTIVKGTDDSLYATELGGEAGSYPVFLWMMDLGTPAFTPGLDYATAKDATRGIQHAAATWATGTSSPNYVYFGADFTNATTPNTYKTTTLRVEAFTE